MHLHTFVWLGGNSSQTAIQTSVNFAFFQNEHLLQFFNVFLSIFATFIIQQECFSGN